MIYNLLLKKLSSSDKVAKENLKDIISSSHTKFKNIQAIFEKYPKQYNLFMEQINFLANTLMSGWDWQSEERRPGRALEITLEICEEGLKDSSEEFSSFRGRSEWVGKKLKKI